MSQFSYSRVDCFKRCPYKYQLRYIEELETLPTYEASNPLHVGSCMHTGIEKGVTAALKQYHDYYPVIDDLQVNEAMKFEHLIPLVQDIIPAGGQFEVKIETDEFKGFIDMLVPRGGGVFDIYDFKYASGVGYVEDVQRIEDVLPPSEYDNGFDLTGIDVIEEHVGMKPNAKLQGYLDSVQLHVYKHFYELTHPGHKIDKLFYVFIPKTQIRQKNSKKETEDLFQFRKRLQSVLNEMEIMVEEVAFDFQKVRKYLDAVAEIKAATEFPKNCTKLCDWCEYKQYCKQGDTTMITMPKLERRKLTAINRKRIFLYGAPMCGKTFFANKFPVPLMLNTDGNMTMDDAAPFFHITAQVEHINGRVKKTPAWDFFIEIIDMLEREQHNPERPKTIVVDVLDHLLERCRELVFEQNGMKHESDQGFGKGYDLVRTPFFNQLKRLNDMNYETIIYIGHEAADKSVTTRNGSLTRWMPSIPSAIADKLQSIVDLTGRVYKEDGQRWLNVSNDNLTYGGFRYTTELDRIPLEYGALMELFASAVPTASAPAEQPAETPAVPAETAPAEQAVAAPAEAPAQSTTRRRVAVK